MKKRFSIMMVVMLLGTASLWARPGYTKPVDVLQPDGTTVTLLMHGDEFYSYMTTTDGYTVIKCDDGYYRYAEKEGDGLKASAFVAKNADKRQADELSFLAGKQKGIRAKMSEAGRQFKEQVSKMYSAAYRDVQGTARRAIIPGTISERINYNNFKGLVVLVNWNGDKDGKGSKQFSINNPQDFYQKLTSQKDYRDDSKTVYPFDVKGSVRDYFYANSMRMFDPTFDVVGPVTIDYSCEYPWPKDAQGNVRAGYMDRMVNILKAVMTEVNKTTNLSNYDLNNDGFIDMVYLVFAGYGSYVQGNNMKLIWPHANDFSEKAYTSGTTTYADYYGMANYDGKKFGRYACSVEIQDAEDAANLPAPYNHAYPDGIGTMCHEFSHVLGLADHYDTDYDENGKGVTPGGYDVMDNGADFNQGLCPVGYNSFERKILGFGDNSIKALEAGDYQLEPFNTSNVAYIVNTAKNGEVFYVENRQKTGWDECLPGAGLLVWRADTSNPYRFTSNNVNIKPGEECFQLMGNKPISTLDLTAENNEIWNTKGAVIDLYDITNTDGVISFEAGKDLYPVTLEDFEATPLAESGAQGLAGKFCTWDLSNAAIVNNSDGQGTGQHVVQLSKAGTLTSSILSKGLRTLKFSVKNAGNSTARFALRTSKDGNNWEILNTISGQGVVTFAHGTKVTFEYLQIPAGNMIQFVVSTSSASATCYLDDLEVSFMKSATGINEITVQKEQCANNDSYNLSGQRVGAGYKGLVIKNGKKIFIK